MDSLTDSGLQSGFVLAVIIGAVLLAGYLGGTQGLAQRAAQVALGLALMLLVFSGTTAFHGLPAIPAEGLEAAFDFDSDSQFLERAAESSQTLLGNRHDSHRAGHPLRGAGRRPCPKVERVDARIPVGWHPTHPVWRPLGFGRSVGPDRIAARLARSAPGNGGRCRGRTRNRPIRGAARRGLPVDVAALFAPGACGVRRWRKSDCYRGTRHGRRP